MKMINPHRLSRRQYKELIESMGGKYGWIDRIKMGGTGVGGLHLLPEEQDDLQLRYKNASESVRLSLEQLKKGILIGFNNTKEVKLLAFTEPSVKWELLEESSVKGSNKVIAKIRISLNDESLVFYTSGWNNKEVFRYLDRLKEAFSST